MFRKVGIEAEEASYTRPVGGDPYGRRLQKEGSSHYAQVLGSKLLRVSIVMLILQA
jgi:hypothetical protein